MKPASNAALSGALIIAGVIGGLGLVPAHAQRYVAVNGHFLPQAQIETLDQQTCASVPDGNYWLQPDGAWGYVGDPNPRGRIGDLCRQRHRSLSERGLLYSPGELLR